MCFYSFNHCFPPNSINFHHPLVIGSFSSVMLFFSLVVRFNKFLPYLRYLAYWLIWFTYWLYNSSFYVFGWIVFSSCWSFFSVYYNLHSDGFFLFIGATFHFIQYQYYGHIIFVGVLRRDEWKDIFFFFIFFYSFLIIFLFFRCFLSRFSLKIRK
jgi:hypothetical protein